VLPILPLGAFLCGFDSRARHRNVVAHHIDNIRSDRRAWSPSHRRHQFWRGVPEFCLRQDGAFLRWCAARTVRPRLHLCPSRASTRGQDRDVLARTRRRGTW